MWLVVGTLDSFRSKAVAESAPLTPKMMTLSILYMFHSIVLLKLNKSKYKVKNEN